MNVPLHHLLRQLRDEGWGWREIAVAFPELGLEPDVDYDAMAASAARHVVRRPVVPRLGQPDDEVATRQALGYVVPWQLQRAV